MAAAAQPLQPRHWLYLDDQRSHEVHVQLAVDGDRASLVTTEFPVGSVDPAEVLQTDVPVRGEAELLELLGEIEDRLAMSGRYFRSEATVGRWAPLQQARRPRPDLRAHEAALPTGGRMRVHHFHGAKDADRLLVDVPRPGEAGRHILAAMDFTFPSVEQGQMEVLHTRLTARTLQSAILREHIEAPRRGFQKLVEPADYARAYGEGWVERARQMLTGATARLVGGASPTPAPAPSRAPEELAKIQAALASFAVAQVRERFVDDRTREHLVETGEIAIRRHVNALRRENSHRVAYDLSIVEAALLVESALPRRSWELVHEEGPKLIRFLHGYR